MSRNGDSISIRSEPDRLIKASCLPTKPNNPEWRSQSSQEPRPFIRLIAQRRTRRKPPLNAVFHVSGACLKQFAVIRHRSNLCLCGGKGGKTEVAFPALDLHDSKLNLSGVWTSSGGNVWVLARSLRYLWRFKIYNQAQRASCVPFGKKGAISGTPWKAPVSPFTLRRSNAAVHPVNA